VRQTFAIGLLGALALLQGCSERELILAGPREDPRAVMQGVELDVPAPLAGAVAVPIRLPAQIANAEWTHRAGNASHAAPHAALADGTTRIWSVAVGEGSGRKHRIGADPVVGGGRIFTLDSRARVAATAPDGAPLWQADLTPPGDHADDASGGGLAYAAGQVFVGTGFGELLALDAASGAVQWRQQLGAGVSGAPTVAGGLVYAVARDGAAWAVRAEDGKLAWQLSGTPAPAGITGVSSPAVNDRLAVFPFASGELVATLRNRGFTLWQASVAGQRLGRAYAQVTDLSGDPVLVGNRLYAGSAAGRAVAIDTANGARIWTAGEGATGPMLVAGGAVFLISDEAQLVRLDAATGARVWAADMPYFLRDNPRRQQAIHAHYGPVLAGGRIFIASSDGLLRAFDPASGALLASAEIPGGAASAPVVAGGTLYVLGATGQLHAFR
jgi:outer membrane protein assembly factor BamB